MDIVLLCLSNHLKKKKEREKKAGSFEKATERRGWKLM